MRPSRRRRGFTALEVLIATILMSVVIAGGLALFGTGSKGLTHTAAHAAIREEAMRLLEDFGRDLDRLVVGDSFDVGAFPSVVEPVELEELEEHMNGARLTFYAYHHRRFHKKERRLELVAHRIQYRVQDPVKGAGVDLYRNDVKVNRIPLHSIEFRFLDPDEAGQLGISPLHAVELILRPLTPGDPRDDRMARHHAQSRVFQLRNIESQYACLLTLKEARAPYPILAMVPSPPRRAKVYRKYRLDQVPLDWMRPLGLIRLEKGVDFDDATVNEHEEVN